MLVKPQRMKKYENYQLASHFLGLNSVEKAKPSAVRDFVAERGGHTVITSILIANNGIGAVKEIRSVRKWAYQTFGDERAISFVAMATPEDLEANAEYIRMADQVVPVPGGTNNNNYANVDLIVDVAEQTGVQAVGVTPVRTHCFPRSLLLLPIESFSSVLLVALCVRWVTKFRPLLSLNTLRCHAFPGVEPVLRM